jgi:NitT/TauT family transport system permease protein
VNGRLRGVLRGLATYGLPPAIAFAVVIGIWEAYVAWRDISILVVPAPSDVWGRLAEDPGYFWKEGWWTLYEATLGLVFGSAVAVALAVVMAHSRPVERGLLPLAIAMKVTPLVAIGPVLIVIFGFGTTPKIFLAALLCFFPMLVNALTGFRDVDPGALEFMRSLRATPWSIFWKLRAPSSLPYVLSALRITYPLALVGAVIAEWFTGNRGLGYVVYSAAQNLRTPELFSAIAVLALIGVAINIALSLLERRVLFWHESVRSTR